MYGFSGPLVIEQISAGLFQVHEGFSFLDDSDPPVSVVAVPAGFVTDFASVPWPASMLIPKSGAYNQAAVVHDYLYTVRKYSRATSDRFFLEGMKALKVNPVKRWTMYQAVRRFGFLAWNAKIKKFQKKIDNDKNF